jgi:hypothetical protein
MTLRERLRFHRRRSGFRLPRPLRRGSL